MNQLEKSIILSHLKVAVVQYVKARDGEEIYRDQKAVRAAIVHQLDDLIHDLGLDRENLPFEIDRKDLDRAASDAQEAFIWR